MVVDYKNYKIQQGYDTLQITYGCSPYHDNRPTYLRVQIECIRNGESVHMVAQYVVTLANRRTAGAIVYNMVEALRLFEKLEELPSKEVKFIICDLGGFLLATKQRIVCCQNELTVWRRLCRCVEKIPVPCRVLLGNYQFSRELVEYAENIIQKYKGLTPTMERMGYVDKAHLIKIQEARQRVGLWK